MEKLLHLPTWLRSQPGGQAACLFLAIIILSLPQTAMLPLIDRDEPRFAEASREMAQSGNYIVPTFNGAPRYAKPPLIYWCQAAAYRLFGENAFAARLPSVLATGGVALLLIAWAGGEGALSAAGSLAAVLYAFCFQTLQQGRVATADGLLVFFMLLAGYAGWRLTCSAAPAGTARRVSWSGWGTVLALATAGGFLTKGPEALLPWLPILWANRRAGGRVLVALAAILAFGLLLVALWAIPAFLQTGGAYWREALGHDVVERARKPLQGHGLSSWLGYGLLLPFYFITFWVSAFPWSVALWRGRRGLRLGPPLTQFELYLAQQAGLVLLVFSMLATKLPHYILPALPFLTLLLAVRAGSSPTQGLSARMARCCVTFAVLLAVMTALASPFLLAHGLSPSPVGRALQEASGPLPAGTHYGLVDFDEPSAVWEMRRFCSGPSESLRIDQVLAYLRGAKGRAVALRSATWATLKTQADPHWQTLTGRGFNGARLQSVEITIVLN